MNIETLKKAYAKIDKIDVCGAAYSKLCATLDNCSDADLAHIASAEIKFVSLMARNRIIKRQLAA